jgi:hypothetical protein
MPTVIQRFTQGTRREDTRSCHLTRVLDRGKPNATAEGRMGGFPAGAGTIAGGGGRTNSVLEFHYGDTFTLVRARQHE